MFPVMLAMFLGLSTPGGGTGTNYWYPVWSKMVITSEATDLLVFVNINGNTLYADSYGLLAKGIATAKASVTWYWVGPNPPTPLRFVVPGSCTGHIVINKGYQSSASSGCGVAGTTLVDGWCPPGTSYSGIGSYFQTITRSGTTINMTATVSVLGTGSHAEASIGYVEASTGHTE